MSGLRLVHPEPVIDPTVPRGILGADRDVIRWVELQLELREGFFDGAMAIGVVYQNQPIAGVVYSGYRKFNNGLVTLEATIASTTPRWCTRPILRAVFRYPFTYLKCVRLQTVCSRKAKDVRAFNERLGFKMEGVGRRAWDGRTDAICFSMLPQECRWLGGEHEQG